MKSKEHPRKGAEASKAPSALKGLALLATFSASLNAVASEPVPPLASSTGEYTHGAGPMTLDADGDGLSNGEEMMLGTDPSSADTDGDGLSDGEEINGSTWQGEWFDYLIKRNGKLHSGPYRRGQWTCTREESSPLEVDLNADVTPDGGSCKKACLNFSAITGECRAYRLGSCRDVFRSPSTETANTCADLASGLGELNAETAENKHKAEIAGKTVRSSFSGEPDSINIEKVF